MPVEWRLSRMGDIGIMIIRSIALAAMLCGAASASAGSLHKCKDAAGNITYQGSACPAGQVPAQFTKAADTGASSVKTFGADKQRPVSRR